MQWLPLAGDGGTNILTIDCCGSGNVQVISLEAWQDFSLRADAIMTSTFRFDGSVSHYGYDKFILITSDKRETISIRDYYFEPTVADSLWNASRPAKTYLDRLLRWMENK